MGWGSSDLMQGEAIQLRTQTHDMGPATELVVEEFMVVSDGFVVELWKRRFGSPFFEVTAPLTSLQDADDAFQTHFHERDLVSCARETETLQRI